MLCLLVVSVGDGEAKAFFEVLLTLLFAGHMLFHIRAYPLRRCHLVVESELDGGKRKAFVACVLFESLVVDAGSTRTASAAVAGSVCKMSSVSRVRLFAHFNIFSVLVMEWGPGS